MQSRRCNREDANEKMQIDLQRAVTRALRMKPIKLQSVKSEVV